MLDDHLLSSLLENFGRVVFTANISGIRSDTGGESFFENKGMSSYFEAYFEGQRIETRKW